MRYDAATWTKTFFGAIAARRRGARAVGDRVELYGMRVSVEWDADGERGAIVVEDEAHRVSRRATQKRVPIYCNFDPIREADDLAEQLYWLSLQRSA
jgi:hypothetical protein